MQILNWQDSNFIDSLELVLSKSHETDLAISLTVANIIQQVVNEKNKGLIKLIKKFDNINLAIDDLAVSEDEITFACE